jgi:hypothetical protein
VDKEDLTNEKLSKKFVNQFDLVNYAISLADNMIRSGRAPRVKVDVDNPVIQILAEIEQGKDYLEEIVEKVKFEPEVVEVPHKYDHNGKEKFKSLSTSKANDKKKSRIVH